jgi:ribosome biogenesis GTPase A
LQKILELINQHQDHSTQCCEDTVFLLGNSGAGKSTTINYLCGRRVVTVLDSEENYLERIHVEDPLDGCSVGYSGDSETRYLRSYLDPTYESGRMFLCDTPGFQDTVSTDVDIANAVAISWAIRRSKSVRLVLIIEANIILAPRGHELKNLFSLFQRFLDNVEDHLESVFVYF